MRSFLGRDILSLKDFERNEFEHVFAVTDELREIAERRQNTDMLKEKTLLTAFYQPSTRTRLATEAAKWASVPIINCGDGWGEHPTQVLTDLYTVNRELAGLDGQRWLLVGDMRMRTMHSILYAFSQFDVEAFVCSPSEMSLLPEFKEELASKDTTWTEVESVEKVIGDVDVIYMEPVVQADYTQSRVERTGQEGLTPKEYQVTRSLLKQAKRSAIVLHSLPRMDELTTDVDETRHQRYWVEAFNGVVMRMALLSLVLGAVE